MKLFCFYNKTESQQVRNILSHSLNSSFKKLKKPMTLLNHVRVYNLSIANSKLMISACFISKGLSDNKKMFEDKFFAVQLLIGIANSLTLVRKSSCFSNDVLEYSKRMIDNETVSSSYISQSV